MSIEKLRGAVLFYGQGPYITAPMVNERYPEIDENLWKEFWWHVVERIGSRCKLKEVRRAIHKLTNDEIAVWVAKYRMGIRT